MSPIASPAQERPATVRTPPAARRRQPTRRVAPAAREPAERRVPRMARAFATLFLEVEAGLRPRRHVQPLLCPVVYARLSEVWVRPGMAGPGRLLSVEGTWWAPGRYDVVALVERPDRVTALAFCLRRGAGGWRVEDLIRPEDGPLPDPPYPVPRGEPDVFELVMG